jgi:hypothetical protein
MLNRYWRTVYGLLGQDEPFLSPTVDQNSWYVGNDLPIIGEDVCSRNYLPSLMIGHCLSFKRVHASSMLNEPLFLDCIEPIRQTPQNC